MKLSKSVKPISYIKSHASEVVRDLDSGGEAVVITLNGEAKAVMQGICQYEKTQESPFHAQDSRARERKRQRRVGSSRWTRHSQK